MPPEAVGQPAPRLRSARPARRAAHALIVSLLIAAGAAAQSPALPDAGAPGQRIADRIRALQAEAARLAGESGTLVGELRKLEVERDLRREELQAAEQALAESRAALQATSERLATLEAQRVAQLPGIQAQLVEIYKRGSAGQARLLFGAEDVRTFVRATRAITALAAINARRIGEHRQTLAARARERAALEQTTRDLEARDAAARRAGAAAGQAVAAHAALIERIDSRRDLTAQYVGELQQAYDRLQQQVASLSAGGTAPVVLLPLAPFRGALDWPAPGPVRGRFGQAAGRLGGTAVRNGIEIAAPEGDPVRAVHAGTVGYAEPFAGFGTLVILDHGANNFSLYGYLGQLRVARGDAVQTGAELGEVGLAPAGPAALYFEMRIDGRSVDPLQWLRPR